MRDLNLMRVPPSRVAEDGKRVPRIPAPIVEPALMKTIYGKDVFNFISKVGLSCKALDFLHEFMGVLTENERTVALKPNGVLSVCHLTYTQAEFGKLGIFSDSFSDIKSLTIDTTAFGIRKESSCADLAFHFLFSAGSQEGDVPDAFLCKKGLEAIDESDRFIFTLLPDLSPSRIRFMSGESTLYYLDVEGIRALSRLPKLAFLWKEEIA